MASPGHHLRPGISLVCAALSKHTGAPELQTFIDANLPHVEQLCLTVDTHDLLDVGLGAGPKVHTRMGSYASTPQRGREDAARLADHEWSLFLGPKECLSAADFAALRRVSPHTGLRPIALGEDAEGRPQIRLWRSGWNLAPDGNGRLVAAGPAAHRPTAHLALDTIDLPSGDVASVLSQSPPPQAGPVLISGMHRSGTSMLARVVNLLGIHLGDQLEGVHTPAHESNAKGHWEDLGAMEFNASVLGLTTGFHSPWEWISDAAIPMAHVDKVHRSGAAQIIKRLEDNGRWGVKDPRICLTLNVWQRAAPDACMVASSRDPLSVARSLHARDGLPVIDGLRLWHAYNTRVLEGCASLQVPLLVVDYNRLLSSMPAELERLAAFLGLTDRIDPSLTTQVADFVEGGLQHHATPDLQADDLATELGELAVRGEAAAMHELYGAMSRAAAVPVQQNAKAS